MLLSVPVNPCCYKKIRVRETWRDINLGLRTHSHTLIPRGPSALDDHTYVHSAFASGTQQEKIHKICFNSQGCVLRQMVSFDWGRSDPKHQHRLEGTGHRSTDAQWMYTQGGPITSETEMRYLVWGVRHVEKRRERADKTRGWIWYVLGPSLRSPAHPKWPKVSTGYCRPVSRRTPKFSLHKTLQKDLLLQWYKWRKHLSRVFVICKTSTVS